MQSKDKNESVELYSALGLYLKPSARLSITVQLPNNPIPTGKSISNWEVMEKLKVFIKPDEFTMLKVTKSTLEFIQFEGETENRGCLKSVTAKLENRSIKLSGFAEALKVRAAEAKLEFPTRHHWDSYFRDAKHMNEMNAGERPDTLHIKSLPCRWFASKKEKDPRKVSEEVVNKVFQSFGEIRAMDIPMLDPYLADVHNKNGTIQTFNFGQELTFEVYVQYKEYSGFVKAMNALRGMKLVLISDEKCAVADIKVDFDKTKYMSPENIRKRQMERNKLKRLEKEREERVKRERELEEKRREDERKRVEEEEKERERKREEKVRKREERRKEREEKRKRKLLEKKIQRDERETARKLALKEREELVAKNQVEAVRLATVLFERIKEEKCKAETKRKMQELENERLKQLEKEEEMKRNEEKARRQKEKEMLKKLAKEEKALRERLVSNLLKKKKEEEEQKRENLGKALTGKTRLKSILVAKNSAATFTKSPPPPTIKSAIVR